MGLLAPGNIVPLTARLSRLASPLPAALVQAGKPEKASLPPTSKEYASECKWSFSRDEGGYPLVAFDGELGDFVCPSMFRDLSDYVFGWPFSHFGEDVFVLDRSRIRGNLPPVSQAGRQPEGGCRSEGPSRPACAPTEGAFRGCEASLPCMPSAA